MKKFSVKVENKEQYDELMRACEENGYRWNGGFDPRNVPHDVSHWIYPWYLTFDEKWIVLYTCSMENIVPFHKAMSYIYGDYKYHYGAKVHVQNIGWGTIIARSLHCYLVKFGMSERRFTGIADQKPIWGHFSDKNDSWWVFPEQIEFAVPITEPTKEECYTAIRNCNTVIVILEDGRKGFAVCSPKDEFDFNTGFEIAYKRAVGK